RSGGTAGAKARGRSGSRPRTRGSTPRGRTPAEGGPPGGAGGGGGPRRETAGGAGAAPRPAPGRPGGLGGGGARAGRGGGLAAGQAEVGDVGHGAARGVLKEDVGRLEVAVQHAALVGVVDGVGQGDEEAGGAAVVAAVARQTGAERAAGDVLHAQEAEAV